MFIDSINLQIALLIFFLLQSSFFSGVEAAFLSLDRIAINRFENSSSWVSKKILYFIENFDLFITSLLLFNLFNNIFATSTATLLVTNLLKIYYPTIELGNFFYSLIFLILFTLILLIISEIPSKRFSIKHPSLLAKMGTIPMVFIFTFSYPAVLLLNKISKFFIKRIIPLEVKKNKNFDKKEFISYIKTSTNEGVLKKIESEMLQSLSTYKNLPVKSILIPRQKMKGFDISDLPQNLPKAIKSFKFNTIPVYDDLKDNIIGVFSKRKLYRTDNWEALTVQTFKKYIEKPIIVPETKNIIEVLSDLYTNNQDLSLITDEYGGIEGFITDVEIINRVLGRIDDQENLLDIQKLTSKTFLIKGDVSIEKINEFFNIDIKCLQAETIGGYIIEKLNNIPKPGTVFLDSYFHYKIKSSTKRKINKLILTKRL